MENNYGKSWIVEGLLYVRTWCINLIFMSPGSNLLITLFNPSGIQKSDSHMFLDFGRRNSFSCDGGNQILFVGWFLNLFRFGIVFTNFHVSRTGQSNWRLLNGWSSICNNMNEKENWKNRFKSPFLKKYIVNWILISLLDNASN